MDTSAMKKMNVLFLCTGNSARSILGESIFNHFYASYGKAFSAGSQPTGAVNPVAMELLNAKGFTTQGLYSKDVRSFEQQGAPEIDVVISVCDAAAQECPIWTGKGMPLRLHWPLPDPAKVTDEEIQRKIFEAVYAELRNKISSFIGNMMPP